LSLEKLTKLSWVYTLQQLGQRTAADNPSLYQAILNHVVEGFEANSGCLALCEQDNRSLRIVAGIDLPARVIGSEVAMGVGVLGWVAVQGNALLLNGDIANDPRFPKQVARNETARPKSALCWPLRANDRIIGVVSVNRSEERPAFAQDSLEQGTFILDLVSLSLTNILLHCEQQRRIEELREANAQLEEAKSQLVQSEKMASVGQLAAGVAHEINNPIGFVNSNLGSLEKYVAQLFDVIARYEAMRPGLLGNADALAAFDHVRKDSDLEFLRVDIPTLLKESRDGIDRVRKIVQSLKDFSHVDPSDDWQWSDLRKELDNTISLAWNELKYKCELVREYGEIPLVECLPGQISQVFLNLLVNASQAIGEKGTITVRTRHKGNDVEIDIADTGQGIDPAHLGKIFDPFYTTKPLGQGTGLGLSISYGIVRKHHGEIAVVSEQGKGTTFTIRFPLGVVSRIGCEVG
jgi:signal transduction histidine kinase